MMFCPIKIINTVIINNAGRIILTTSYTGKYLLISKLLVAKPEVVHDKEIIFLIIISDYAIIESS